MIDLHINLSRDCYLPVEDVKKRPLLVLDVYLLYLVFPHYSC